MSVSNMKLPTVSPLATMTTVVWFTPAVFSWLWREWRLVERHSRHGRRDLRVFLHHVIQHWTLPEPLAILPLLLPILLLQSRPWRGPHSSPLPPPPLSSSEGLVSGECWVFPLGSLGKCHAPMHRAQRSNRPRSHNVTVASVTSVSSFWQGVECAANVTDWTQTYTHTHSKQTYPRMHFTHAQPLTHKQTKQSQINLKWINRLWLLFANQQAQGKNRPGPYLVIYNNLWRAVYTRVGHRSV